MPNEDTQYRLNVTDANGCTAEAIFPILISECRPATVTTISTNSTICGEAEGSANIQLEQPISDYTFRWMPDLGQATETEARRSNLPAGGYRVQIIAIGDTSCVTEAVVVIENTDAPTAQADVQAATCQSNTGQANLQPTSFDYLWEDGSTLSQRADLVAGTYLITVTDPTRPDCSNTLQVVISNQNVLSTTASIDRAPDCGQSNGEVSIAAMGGSGDYTYLWADSTTTATRTDLPSGIYSVTVTDNAPTNCTAVVNFTLTDAVSVATISNLNATDITCNGDSNGRLSFEITFDDDFSFPADTIFTQEERTVANGALMAGQVCLTILDANGCVAGGECIAIGEPEVLQITLNTTQGCQSDGTISGAISGGTMPYVVNWQDLTESDNALNRTNLMSGTYTLTITDANDCILENTIVVPACQCAPPRLTSIQTTAANCETSNGAIRLQIERPEDYVFTWLPDIGTANETGNRRTGLPSGGYQIRIAERNNPACDTIVSAIITPDLALDITQSISAASCANSDGAVLLSPADFEYEWADNMTTNERSDLATGVYFVTVTDPERPDCPQVEEVRIGEDNDLTAAITINQMPNCGESNGSVTLNVMGGSGNYTYSWESATATQDGLAAGVYPITITDNAGAGCILPFTFLLLDDVAAATVEVITVRDISCTGLQDGRLDFSVEFDEEFVAPAQIFITDGNSELVNGSLAAGDYCLQINDGNGCVAGGTCFTIAEPNPIVLDVTLTSACDSTGSIVINPTGGVAPYRFDWSDIEGTDNPKDRTDLNTGSYAVTVTDANDCTLVETDIQLDTCQVCDLFMTDTSFVQTSDCLGTAKFCFDLDAAEVPNYEKI
ncbi:MAG: SprB repeat-containing protein, partial [Bacteroidota bacterium]